VEVKFTNTGVGISKEQIKGVFESIFTTKSEGKWPSVGLASSRSGVEQHHRTITVDSQSDKETTITVTFPV